MKPILKQLLVLPACFLLLSCGGDGGGGSGNSSSNVITPDDPDPGGKDTFPEISIKFPKYASPYAGTEQEFVMLKQGENLPMWIQSTKDTGAPITLNFRIRESKSVIRPGNGAPPKPADSTSAPYDTTLQLNRLNLNNFGMWGTEPGAISLTDEPATIGFELLPGSGYLVDGESNRLEYIVDNPQKARIDVAVLETTVSEGEKARFAIGWTGRSVQSESDLTDGSLNENVQPETDLTVNLSVRQEGDFTSVFPSTIAVTKSSGFSSVLEIPTTDDDISEANGKITVEVLPGRGYTSYSLEVGSNPRLSSFFSNPSVNQVTVLDNDQPRISVSPVEFPVYEGDFARFAIKSETNAPANDLTVNISTITTGDFFYQTVQDEFVLNAGRRSDLLEIPTEDDTDAEQNGSVRVEIKPGSGYVLANHTYASIEVWDDDIPVIRVDAVEQNLMEGGLAVFDIKPETGQLAADLTVNIAISRDGGDFLDSKDFSNGIPHETIFLAEGEVSKGLAYSTVDDDVSELDGRVGLEIRPGKGYRPAVESFAFVNIMDDDMSVWVEAPETVVYEGDVAKFLIGTGDSPHFADRTVNLEVEQQGNFFAGSLPTSVSLNYGSRTRMLEFPTVVEDAVAPDGSITVRILDGTGYKKSSRSSSTVTVKDQSTRSVPKVFVSALRESVEEGEQASFLIGTDAARLASPLTVHFELQMQGSFLDPVHTSPLPTTLNIEPGRTIHGRAAGIHGYHTENDETDETDGSITLALQDRAGYNVQQGQGAATVRIADNDEDSDGSLPEISIEPAENSTITEGQAARFRLHANSEVSSDITVHYSISIPNEFTDYLTNTHQEEILSGQRERIFEIPTANNGKKGNGGKLTVTLRSGQGYSLGAATTAEISILEKLNTPELRIEHLHEFPAIEEGQAARFMVSATSELERNAYVRMSVSGPKNLIDLSDFERSFILTPAEQTYEFSIPTFENDIHESDREFTVHLLDGNGYELMSRDSVTITVADNDNEPVISINWEPLASIDEGMPATFRLSSPTAPLLDLPVKVTVSGGEGFLAPMAGGDRMVVIEGGSQSAVFAVETVADDVEENNAEISAAIVDGVGYSVSSLNGSAVAMMEDNDTATLPEITIETISLAGVTEGSPARFRLTSSKPATDVLSVIVNVTQTGSFVDRTQLNNQEWIIQSGTSTEFSVNTMPDDTEEPNGSITVVVEGRGHYAVGTNFRASVEVFDDDVPEDAPEMTIAADTTRITEGGIAWFRLSASPAPDQTVSVSVAVSTTGSFMTRLSNQRTIRIAGGRSSKVFGVGIADDRIAGSDGIVTAKIEDEAGYTVGATGSANISVSDNDGMPVFSIETVRPPDKTDRDYAYVDEGEPAVFQITTPTAPALPLELKVYVGGSSNFISGRLGERTVKVAAGYHRSTLVVDTTSDSTYEYAGVVRATIMDSQDYSTGASRSAYFQVNDSSEFPTLTISAGISRDSPVTEVNEGDPAEFIITSSAALLVDLPVIVYVSAPPNLVSSPAESLGHRTIVLPKGSKRVKFTVNTAADFHSEPDGSITATVLNSTGYELDVGQVRITVLDDDKSATEPVVSVTTVSTSGVEEGSRAYFQLSSPVAPGSAITVNYDVSGTESFIDGSLGRRTETWDAGQKTKEFHVNTVSNSRDEANGRVYVTIARGAGYHVGQAYAASVVIRDDDQPEDAPILSLFELPGTVYEGEDARFRILVTNQPSSDLTLRYAVSGSDSRIGGGPGIRTMTISSERIAITPYKTLNVSTIDNSITDPDGHGSVTVSLLSGTGYVLSDRFSTEATVTVFDNDEAPDSPVITIASLQNTAITEGTPAWFEVTTSKVPVTEGLAVGLFVDAPASLVPVVFDVNWGFHVQNHWTVVIPTGQTQVRFGFDTDNDIVDEPGGSVTVTIQDRTGYEVGNPGSASADVEDDDPAPVISVYPVRSWIREGEQAVFRLSSPTDANSYLNVNVSIRSTGDYLNEPYGFKTLDVESYNGSIPDLTSGHATFDLHTDNDNVDEQDGSVTVTVLKGAGYTVGSSPSATMSILDDDGEPSVIIERWSASRIIEGESAGFYVQSLPAPQSNLDVALSLSYSGDFFGGVLERRTVTIQAETSTGFFNIPTFDDDVYEANGYAAAEILEGNYGIGYQNRISVAVLDDDDPPLEQPVFSISFLSLYIHEGETARFRISTPLAPSTPTSVKVRISNTMGILTGHLEDRTLEFMPGQSEQILDLITVQDEQFRPDVTITATVLTSSKYEVGSKNRAAVNVLDIKVPKISISAHRDSAAGVTEAAGATAKFVIESDIQPWHDLMVNIRLDDGAANVLMQTDPYEVKVSLPTTDADRKVTFEVPIKNDDTAGTGGDISVTVISGTGYVPGTPSQSIVTVADDDSGQPGGATGIQQVYNTAPNNPDSSESQHTEPFPKISISAHPDSLEEGETAEFKITSDSPAGSVLQIRTVLQQTGDFVMGELEHTLKLDPGQESALLAIQTQDDQTPEDDGTVTATVHEGAGYTVSTQNIATVNVSDAEDRERHERFMNIRNQIAESAESAMPAVLDALSGQTFGNAFQRMDLALSESGAATAEFDKNSKLTNLLRSVGKALNDGSASLLSILDGESFSTELFPENGKVSPVTIWGAGDSQNLANSNTDSGLGGKAWSGDLLTGQFGADLRLSPSSVTGLAMAVGESKVDFDSSSTILYSRFTSFQSHAGFKSPGEDFQLQTVAGYGTGDTDFTIEDFEGISVRSSHYALAGRWKWQVFNEDAAGGRPGLALTAGAETARQFMNRTGEYFDGLRIDASRFHLAASGFRTLEPASGTQLDSSASFTLRGKSKSSDWQLELGMQAETAYRKYNAIGIEGSVEIQPTLFGQNEFASFLGSLEYDSGYDRLGLLAHLSFSSGRQPNRTNAHFFDRSGFESHEYQLQHSIGSNFNTQLGYGFSLGFEGANLTPFSELELNSREGTDLAFGSRFSSGQDISFELKGNRSHKRNQTTEYEVKLKGNLKM